MDLNPQFQNLALARVEEIAWKDTHGIEVKAGLYWPIDYIAGKKYPLIVQTHDWEPDKFWMDGPWVTAFAAQALAGKGFFVLQVPDPDWHIWSTAKEVPRAMAAYESAIGSKHHFTAAAVADGVDYSYFQYMALPDVTPDSEQMLGGSPYGKSMSQWLKRLLRF
jgi:hypothetical protein